MYKRNGQPTLGGAFILTAMALSTTYVERAAAQSLSTSSQASKAFSFSLSSPGLLFAQEEGSQASDESERSDTVREGQQEEAVYVDQSGNDPRDFRNKFMPYYRFTELRNGLQAHEWVMFGFWAITPRLGMTYEIPIKYVDASEAIPGGFSLNPPGPIGGPPIPGFGGRVGPDIDAHQAGLGDTILRFFYRPEATEWQSSFTWGPRKGEKSGGAFMPILETTLPTNTDDLLGSDTWVLSPGFVVVQDTPTFGFIAAMFFYDFNAIKSSDESYVSRFRARIFWLQPFSKPGPNLFDGMYMMPEFQPIYDMREGRFSMWIGPEFGKIMKMDDHPTIDTISVYAKPGWGWAPHDVGGDREFSMEIGVRVAF